MKAFIYNDFKNHPCGLRGNLRMKVDGKITRGPIPESAEKQPYPKSTLVSGEISGIEYDDKDATLHVATDKEKLAFRGLEDVSDEVHGSDDNQS